MVDAHRRLVPNMAIVSICPVTNKAWNCPLEESNGFLEYMVIALFAFSQCLCYVNAKGGQNVTQSPTTTMTPPRKVMFVAFSGLILLCFWLSSSKYIQGNTPRSFLGSSDPCMADVWREEVAANTVQTISIKKGKATGDRVGAPEKSESRLFPTKIWQSWKDDSQDPTERTKGFPGRWRDMNPSHSYERITDDTMQEFVAGRFDGPVLETFSRLDDAILRADYLRYLILLREGGVWADIDVLPHQPVSNWIPSPHNESNSVNIVIGIETDHHKRPVSRGITYSVCFSQYTVLAKPGHPVLKKLVNQVTADLQTLLAAKAEQPGAPITFSEVMKTTGPFAFTQVFMDYFTEKTGIEHTGDEFDRLSEPRLIEDVLVLPKDSFGWLPHENTHSKDDPMVLVEHLFQGSWRDGHPG